ncbi:hypothetical protein D1007_24378 [Hordeum vulgare]|nr:hypothetical protein D1007_24378 [Hordeum vulgare]
MDPGIWMVDDDGPWYDGLIEEFDDGLIEEFDKEHRARAIENRKSDQSSTRTKDTSSFCGFVWSLCVWMWEWLTVGRPVIKNPDNPNLNPHEGIDNQDPYRCPTIAYYWDHVSVYTGSSHVRYKCYVNELDTLTTEQVFWRPYENDRDFNLNEMCTRDNLLWQTRCPMISLYAVKWHFVDRVARQFVKVQGIPIEESKETITKLHRFSRRNDHYILDWANKHDHWIAMWNQRETFVELENRPHNDSAYQKYLVWYGQRYRLKLKPGWTQEEWSELVLEDPSFVEGQRVPYVR